MFVYTHPDPVALALGPLHVRWYGLMYLVGFLGAWWLARRRAARPGSTWNPTDVDDLIFFCAVGVIFGGRLGWMLFYGTERLFSEPLSIFRIWEGGMSFHGGLVGVMLALAVFARKRGRALVDVFDFTAPLPAIGFAPAASAISSTANCGASRPTCPGPSSSTARRCIPSQLYEATLEGLVLFVILWWFTAQPRHRWAPSGLFLLCYGVFRFLVEFVRVPDDNRGYLLFDWVTMGQILSTPMILAGVLLLAYAYRSRVPSGNYRSS